MNAIYLDHAASTPLDPQVIAALQAALTGEAAAGNPSAITHAYGRAAAAQIEHARERIESTTSSSFACDLRKWLQIMEAYEAGGHAYHATMPTDALTRLREVMQETRRYGFAKVRAEQQLLGDKVRALFQARGIASVAAPGFQAPGVVVSYTEDPDIQSSKKFLGQGLRPPGLIPG